MTKQEAAIVSAYTWVPDWLFCRHADLCRGSSRTTYMDAPVWRPRSCRSTKSRDQGRFLWYKYHTL